MAYSELAVNLALSFLLFLRQKQKPGVMRICPSLIERRTVFYWSGKGDRAVAYNPLYPFIAPRVGVGTSC